MPAREFEFNPTLKARGRNLFNADRLRIRRESEAGHGHKGHVVYIENRVASTGGYNMGWNVFPGDPAKLRELAEHFSKMADEIEAAIETQEGG